MRRHLKALVVIPCLGAACSRGASGRTDTLPHVAAAPTPVAAPRASAFAAVPAGSVDTAAHPPAVFDSVLAKVHAGRTACYQLEHYFVVERNDGETGADVLVRRRDADAGPEPACALDSLSGDFVSRNDSVGAFDGIHGRWLFLGDSDAPGGGNFVYDLATGRNTIHLDGEDLVRWPDSVTVELWVPGDTVSHARCSDVPAGMVAGIDSLVAINLQTGARSSLGRSRCAARE